MGEEAVKSDKYFCTKCNRFHSLTSNEGKKHIEFRGEKKDDSSEAKIDEELKGAIRSLIDRYVRESIDKYLQTMNTERRADIERDLEVTDVLKIPRRVNLSPQVIQYYQWYISKSGDDMTIDDFINEVIEEHFNDCLNVEIGIITRPGRGRRLTLRGE